MGFRRVAAVSSSSIHSFYATARRFVCSAHLGSGYKFSGPRNSSLPYQWEKHGNSMLAGKFDFSQYKQTSFHMGASAEKVSSRSISAGAVSYAASGQSGSQMPRRRTGDERGGSTRRERAANLKSQQQRPIVFECRECHAMSVTRISKDSYERGVVILRCMDCMSVNLISDRLNLFQGIQSVHKFLEERGIDAGNTSKRIYEWTPEALSELGQPSAVPQ